MPVAVAVAVAVNDNVKVHDHDDLCPEKLGTPLVFSLVGALLLAFGGLGQVSAKASWFAPRCRATKEVTRRVWRVRDLGDEAPPGPKVPLRKPLGAGGSAYFSEESGF